MVNTSGDSALPVLSSNVLTTWWIILLTIYIGKPFKYANLLEDGYNYVSFDVKSLFTNVPIKTTIDIILKRIYIDKFISNNLKKLPLKSS